MNTVFRRVLFLLGCFIAVSLVPMVSACTTTANSTLTIATSCGFGAEVAGVDNGNIIINPGVTLTVQSGQTLLRNSGNSIQNNGNIVLIGTAKIMQSYLWCLDADTDGYCASLTYSYGDVSPGAGYRRLTDMTTLATADCSDSVYGNSCAKRVFAMAVSNGNLGGLAGADSLCQSRANTYISNPGTFKAWMSSTTVSASSRMTHFAGNYALVDSTVIANDWTDLTDGTIDNSISKDANGAAFSSNTIYTDTSAAGAIFSANATYNCNNWTNAGVSYSHSPGATNATDYYWSTTNTPTEMKTCNYAGGIFCFEQ
jgi:hypothetical protein